MAVKSAIIIAPDNAPAGDPAEATYPRSRYTKTAVTFAEPSSVSAYLPRPVLSIKSAIPLVVLDTGVALPIA